MAENKETTVNNKSETHHGTDMTPEELEEYYKAFQLVEDSIEGLTDEEEE